MGGGRGGNFGNTYGKTLDAISNVLTAASLIPGVDTFADIAAIPVDLLRGDFLSAGLDALGAIPFVGEIADIAKTAKTADNIIDTAKAVDKVTDAAKAADNARDIGRISEKAGVIAKRSPIKIPQKAKVQIQAKNGYSQIKYTWESRNYQYTSRWHSRTPNAPKDQVDSWVVERRIPGIGYGKNVRPKREEVLVGKNKWISKRDWNEAITARKNGTATKQQKEWLDNGHWKDR